MLLMYSYHLLQMSEDPKGKYRLVKKSKEDRIHKNINNSLTRLTIDYYNFQVHNKFLTVILRLLIY